MLEGHDSAGSSPALGTIFVLYMPQIIAVRPVLWYIHHMNTTDITKTILARRKERGLTQGQLAQSANVSREMISRLENNDGDIGLRRLLRICGALGLELIVRPGRGRPTAEDLDNLFGDDD